MIEFLQSLLEQGIAIVSLVPDGDEDASAVAELLREFDQRQRAHLAGEVPELDAAGAEWAARMLHDAVRLLAARDVDAAGVESLMSRPCPVPRSPSVDYSVDLFFQHLPEVHLMASRLSANDPLVHELLKLGAAWPLSSVGMPLPESTTLHLQPILKSHALLSLYADRILLTGDTTRLTSPEVKDAVAATVGAYPDLSPKVAQHLRLPLLDLPH